MGTTAVGQYQSSPNQTWHSPTNSDYGSGEAKTRWTELWQAELGPRCQSKNVCGSLRPILLVTLNFKTFADDTSKLTCIKFWKNSIKLKNVRTMFTQSYGPQYAFTTATENVLNQHWNSHRLKGIQAKKTTFDYINTARYAPKYLWAWIPHVLNRYIRKITTKEHYTHVDSPAWEWKDPRYRTIYGILTCLLLATATYKW